MGFPIDALTDEELEAGVKATAQAFAAAGVTVNDAHEALGRLAAISLIPPRRSTHS